ncbi:hypothetical protein K3X44_10010 [Aliiroseovarius crassostreae]|uniref:hypothetical protein n=1 Tax=Aliiroseovarius crassostreae TaxID=154981 RepID=UPI00220AD5C2|nr:hypothetical protein [Aliiroseovarius crassostreae]UWQ00848.1 hypothetical protein K3X44_10010 [Aliiroseovarius crassostreae]
MAKFIVSATSKDGFWRCGRHFTNAGIPVSKEDFTDKEWARLEGEKMLRIRPATKEDLGALSGRADTINGAIRVLTADDFQNDGKPKLAVLNTLLADEVGKISAAERDAVWEELVADGFEAPKASE